jgi:hypothetical protein
MCDDDGQCDPAPDKIIDRKVMEGTIARHCPTYVINFAQTGSLLPIF